MKLHYLKNSGEYHSRLTKKLAVLLLALPVSGAFAAYTNTTGVTAINAGVATIGDNAVTAAALNSTTVAGTASTPNTSYVGWASGSTISASAQLYWVGGAVANEVGLAATSNMSVGGTADAGNAHTSSSYNTLTVGDYVTLQNIASLTIGAGATLDGAVDPDVLGGHNALTISGAGVTSTGSIIHTELDAASDITVGEIGSNNSLTIATGAKIASSAGALIVGSGTDTDATAGCNNTVSVSGKVSVSLIGNANPLTSTSTLSVKGVSIGSAGSSNSVTVSDNGILALNSASLTIGELGSNNTLTVDKGTLSGATTVMLGVEGKNNKIVLSNGSTLAASNDTLIGSAAEATGNEISLAGSTYTGLTRALVGIKGSANKLTIASSSTMTVASMSVGYGDSDAINADHPAYVATMGCNNVVTVTDSIFNTLGNVAVGTYGSGNTLTVTNSGFYAVAEDLDNPADGIQLDEVTGIDELRIGWGRPTTITLDNSALGCNNAVTFSNCLFSVADATTVGLFGSNNSLTIKDGSTGAFDGLFIGFNYNDTKAQQELPEATGCNNSVTVTDSTLKLTDDIFVGEYGNNNSLSVTGSTITMIDSGIGVGEGNPDGFGGYDAAATEYGSNNTVTFNDSTISTAEIGLGNYGSNNSIVIGEGAQVDVSTNVKIGNMGSAGSIADGSSSIFSHDNKLTVEGASALTLGHGTLTVGHDGQKNELDITGGSVAWIKTGAVSIGEGADSVLLGYGNKVTVSGVDSRLVVNGAIYLGAFDDDGDGVFDSGDDTLGSGNEIYISDGAIVAANEISVSTLGQDNYIYVKDGYLALLGKAQVAAIGDLISGGYVKIYDAATSSYKTATASDVTVKYYSAEADAKTLTGYNGLAGYTILSANAIDPAYAWANVSKKTGSYYQSSWYGWFYSEVENPSYIMSYNDNNWQYVDPSSSSENAYFYAYAVGSWIYTNAKYMEQGWYYNYAISDWAQF